MDTRISRDTSNSKNALNNRKASNSNMFKRNRGNANNTIVYARNVSNSRENSNRKPSGT
jgi:hypothetical protein